MKSISNDPEKLYGILKWIAIIVATFWASAHFYTVAIYKEYNNPTLPGLIHGWTVTWVGIMGLIPVFILLVGARYNFFLMTIFYDVDMGLILFSRTLPVPVIGGPLPWVPTAIASLAGDIILITLFTSLEILDKKIVKKRLGS